MVLLGLSKVTLKACTELLSGSVIRFQVVWRLKLVREFVKIVSRLITCVGGSMRSGNSRRNA